MLQRVVRLVGTVAERVTVVAAPHQPLPTIPASVSIVCDRVEGRGPLAGLAAGFSALSGHVDLAYATATDVPYLQPRWITRLAELIGEHDLAIPFVDGFHHPLAALYRVSAVCAEVDRLLALGRGPASLVDAVKTRIVTAEELRGVDPTLATLRNLNTPEDYQRALCHFDFGR